MKQHSDGYLFEQIAESIRLQIARGELQGDERLPSIREMAAAWGCTAGTVNRAYAILADEGLVASFRGGGTRVVANALTGAGTPLRSAILINQVEALMLNLLSQGYSEAQVGSAFGTALSRWHALRDSSQQQQGPSPDVLRFAGSNDLTIDYLAGELERAGGYQLTISYRGSLGGLIALARGEADIAGSHLWDEPTDSYNVPYVQRVLPGRRTALVTVARRSFGLIVAPGNPDEIKKLGDLARKGVRWINRQPGSGTRVWLDAQLKQQGVNTAGIKGYEESKSTHLEVASAVQSGEATAGLGIKAAAAAYELDFVPLAEENYQLVVPETIYETAACQALLAVLETETFADEVQGFGGYDTSAAGEIMWVV